MRKMRTDMGKGDNWILGYFDIPDISISQYPKRSMNDLLKNPFFVFLAGLIVLWLVFKGGVTRHSAFAVATGYCEQEREGGTFPTLRLPTFYAVCAGS